MSALSPLRIDVHFDPICPWCFIGLRQLARARERFARTCPKVDVRVAWHPVQLLPDVPEHGVPFAGFYLQRLGSPEAVDNRMRQVEQAAQRVGLRLDLRGIPRMPNTSRALRLLNHAAGRETLATCERLLEALFAAHFQRGQDIGDIATLRALAGETGVALAGLDLESWPCATPPPSLVAGVPHFVFNGGRYVHGAQDEGLLLLAMIQSVQADRAEPAGQPSHAA